MLFLALAIAASCEQHDIVVYGGTVCGVTATVAAHRTDPALKIVWLVNGTRLGGMTSGGLGGLDAGMPIGGLAKELIAQLTHNFEPHVAEAAVESLLGTANSSQVRLHRSVGEIVRVATRGTAPRTIASISLASGLTVCGSHFIDCSYEGDLLRLSGTRYAVGRESRSEYNESMAGRDDRNVSITADAATPSFFAPSVSPWVDATNTTLLPTVVEVLDAEGGSADDWPMSYCFRLCLTNNASNRVVVAPPAGYDRAEVELLRRELDWATHVANMTLGMDDLFLIRHLPNAKIDLNSGQFSEPSSLYPDSHRHGGYFPFSTDAPGLQRGWPLGNRTTRAQARCCCSPFHLASVRCQHNLVVHLARAQIFAAHERQHRALLHFLGTDAELATWQPALVQEVASWGLAADEFLDSDHWPVQLYVRESIRLRGPRVLTQARRPNTDLDAALRAPRARSRPEAHSPAPQHDIVGPGKGPREPTSVGTSKWGVDVRRHSSPPPRLATTPTLTRTRSRTYLAPPPPSSRGISPRRRVGYRCTRSSASRCARRRTATPAGPCRTPAAATRAARAGGPAPDPNLLLLLLLFLLLLLLLLLLLP